VAGERVSFAYAPIVLDAGADPLGTVRFHLARANPVAVTGGFLSFSFRGPDAYISPDWYDTPSLVPTWNYMAVEATGHAVRLSDDDLKDLLVALSAQHEAALAPKKPWTIDKIPGERLAQLMTAITGFSVRLETLRGKFKLSQEKSGRDASGVIEGLEQRSDAGSLAVAGAMRSFRAS
jgi:transcriptional regulator